MSDWPSAVLFDFDGVIVNSEPVHLRATQLAAEQHGIRLSTEEYYRELIGYDDAGAWRRIFGLHARPLDEAALRRAMNDKFRFMRELLERQEVPALPGVDAFVSALAAHGRPMAICSGAIRAEILAMLAGVRLEQHFRLVTAAEDVAIGKPDPSGYLLTAHRLSEKIGRPLRPHDCLVVEDAPAVVRSVRAVGFKTLAVATTYPIEQLGDADWAVETLRTAELSRTIGELSFLFNGDVENR